MKKIFILLILFFGIFLFSPPSSLAYEQTEEICYSQCLAYKFIWRGDWCYNLFMNQCSISSGDAAIKTVMILKNLVSSILSGQRKEIVDIGLVFKAFLVCKPLIEECLVPVFRSCEWDCKSDPHSYAPDFAVGSYQDKPSIYYDKNSKELRFRVINIGDAYAWDIDVAALYGWTRGTKGVDDEINNFQSLFEEKIDHLIFQGARNGPPKNITDYVKDFLIDESRFSSWLQDYKSDAKNYNIPTEWTKTIPFEPKEDALNRIVLKVNYNNTIPEKDWNSNELVYDIDLRPNPPETFIEQIQSELYQTYLKKFQVRLLLKNYGDLTDEVLLQFREGTTEGEGGLFYEREIVEPVKNTTNEQGQWFNYLIDVNPEGVEYCGVNKKYQIEMTDSLGKKKIKRFSLPIYFPEISGRISNLSGKPVKGAVVKAQTGDEATTNEYGFYRLKVKNLTYFVEKINLTVTHPEYSQTQTKELTISQKNTLNPCEDLTFSDVDFVLKDVDVKFTVEVYEKKTGALLDNVFLVATNLEGEKVGSRVEKTINGETPLPEIQPGKFFFTLSKSGYKTLGQIVNAVPENQVLKFYMEKMSGRPNDESLILQKPQLLWEVDLGNEIFVDMRASKNGKLVVFYTSQNKPKTGKLYFFDPFLGPKTKGKKTTVSTISNAGNSSASIDTSYDGSITTLCSNDGKTFGKDRGKNWIQLFDNSGNLIGEKEYDNTLATDLCEVSPDGFYLYPYFLMNKGFYEYTRFDTEGLLDNDKPSLEKVVFGSYRGTYFTPDNSVIGAGDQNCTVGIHSIFGNKLLNCLAGVEGNIVFTDSSSNSETIATLTDNKVYLFKSGSKIFEKEATTRKDFLTVGVTPGGDYLIYTTNNEKAPYRIFKIYDKNKKDITPLSEEEQTDLARKGEDVVYVAANDKGIFYASLQHKKLRFYQVGKYTTEYQEETYPTPTKTFLTSGISILQNDKFLPLESISFSALSAGAIYKAEQTTSFGLENGTITLTEGTLFSVDNEGNPVLLKGQITADFNSPIKIYAIKFDRYDLGVFQNKLDQFINHQLEEEEYFLVKNIHTKFTVKNEQNTIAVAVEKGEVEVKGKNIEEKVSSGKKITIDKEGSIKKSAYFGEKVYKFLILGVLILGAIFLIIYRNTKTGKLIFKILRKIWETIILVVRKIATFLINLVKNFVKMLKYKIIKNKK